MRVIKKGTKREDQAFRCQYCKCEFVAEKGEWSSSEDRDGFFHYSKCPECGCPVYKSGNIPRDLHFLDLT